MIYILLCFFLQIRVVVSTAAFYARVRGSIPGLGGLKETKMFLPHSQEVLLAQLSLYVHKGGLKPDSFYFNKLVIHIFDLYKSN